MNHESEAELLVKVREGDVAALGNYLENHRPQLLGFIKHITGEHLLRVIEVEDLFQEVARSALSAFPKIPKDDLDVNKWLEQLARRRVVDAHREHFGAAKRSANRNQVFSQIAKADEDSPGIEQLLIASMTSPSMAVSRNWKLVRLQKAISELDEFQQNILLLRYRDGLPSAEIAKQTGKSDGAIRVALSRVLARMQELLGASPPQS